MLTVDHQAADLLDHPDCLGSVCCHAEIAAAVPSACCGYPLTVPCLAQAAHVQAACKARVMTFVSLLAKDTPLLQDWMCTMTLDRDPQVHCGLLASPSCIIKAAGQSALCGDDKQQGCELLSKVAEMIDDIAISRKTFLLLESLCSLLQTRNTGLHVFQLLSSIATKALNNLAQKAHDWLQ